MFTGIIKTTARVKSIDIKKQGGSTVVVEKTHGWLVKKGESIAVNGVCLTVVGLKGGWHFNFMPETATRSTVGSLRRGDMINLEQAMRMDDRLNGHIVQGHVDTIGAITALIKDGDSYILKITPRDAGALRWVVEKGSVTVDGISLTVVKVTKKWFTVNILPYTRQETNLHTKKLGDKVNIEVDVLAKYVEKFYANRK